MAVAGGLGKTVIEAAAAGAADVRPDAVKDLAALLVAVEAVIEKLAQKTPALGRAVSDGAAKIRVRVAERGRVGSAVLEQ